MKEDLADVPSGFWDKGLFQEPVEVADIVSTSAPTRRHRVVRKDHGVFAQHNKFGTFEVPKTFLNNDKEAAKCAAKVAEKQAAKKAVKQSKTAQKTKKEASAEQAKAVPFKAVRATPSKVESSAVSFRTLALLGVVAVFGASLTQPSALGSQTQGPSVGVPGVACSPQWLPMIMGQTPAEPPMPPPTPPPPHSPPSTVSLGVKVTAHGDLTDPIFSEDGQGAIKQNFATAAGVEAETVGIVVQGGSVFVTLTIPFVTEGDCLAVRDLVFPKLQTPALAAKTLGIPVTIVTLTIPFVTE